MCCAFSQLVFLFLTVFILTKVVFPSESYLLNRPCILLPRRRAASLKNPVLKHSKHGANVVVLPFDSSVTLSAFFALCCDVHCHPGPEQLCHRHSVDIHAYSRAHFHDIGKSVSSTAIDYTLDSRTVAYLKLNDIYNTSLETPSNTRWFDPLDKVRNSIPTRITTTKRRYLFIQNQNTANLRNCIVISKWPVLHTNDVEVSQDNDQHLSIPVRITSRHTKKSTMTIHNSRNSRNLANLTSINTVKSSSDYMPRLRFGTWNAHSLSKKAASICDLVISKRIDILSLTETWLAVNNNSEPAVAEMLNALQDYEFLHSPRSDRKGGGVGVLLRKGFSVKRNVAMSFRSFEHIDVSVAMSNSSLLRLITVHRPPPSKKNKHTVQLFFDEFSSLLEHLAVVSGNLIISGYFQFSHR